MMSSTSNKLASMAGLLLDSEMLSAILSFIHHGWLFQSSVCKCWQAAHESLAGSPAGARLTAYTVAFESLSRCQWAFPNGRKGLHVEELALYSVARYAPVEVLDNALKRGMLKRCLELVRGAAMSGCLTKVKLLLQKELSSASPDQQQEAIVGFVSGKHLALAQQLYTAVGGIEDDRLCVAAV